MSVFGSWVIVTAIVIVIVAGVLGLLPGMLLGGRSAEVRTTTGLVSVFRFASLGLIIIGAQLHADPVYLGPALTFALVDFILPLALAVELGHRAGRRKQSPRSAATAASASSPSSRQALWCCPRCHWPMAGAASPRAAIWPSSWDGPVITRAVAGPALVTVKLCG